MQFQTLTYLLFLCLVTSLFWLLPHRFRKSLLLCASLLFYCWFRWDYGLLLAFVIVNHFYLTRAYLKQRKRWFAYLSILNSLLVLFFFKYFNFFLKSFNNVFQLTGASYQFNLWDILLPLGISFFVFQAISYTVDCLRDEKQEIPSFIDFSLYITFWPQLVAGADYEST